MEANKPIITGLNGCSCHPFESWEECKKYHTQQLSIDTEVKNRCTGKIGKVIEVHTGSDKGFVIVKYGKYRSDEHLEHVASLITHNS